VNVFAIHIHPSTFENPLDFNLGRFVGSEIDVRGTYFQLLPFGFGR
jgi:cytochrome P450